MTHPEIGALTTSECWRLLRSRDVGRLAVCVDQQPRIYPLNYVVDHGSLVLRTADATKLPAGVPRPQVAFEVDTIAADAGRAWSVVLTGTVERVRGTDDLIAAMGLPLSPWYVGPDQRYLRLVVDEVTGRRVEGAVRT